MSILAAPGLVSLVCLRLCLRPSGGHFLIRPDGRAGHDRVSIRNHARHLKLIADCLVLRNEFDYLLPRVHLHDFSAILIS